MRILIPSLLLLLAGCQQYYLTVNQQWVDVNYLASTHVHTPDPRQSNPPLGQMLILDWRVPEDVYEKNPEVVLDVVLWNYTTREIRFPIKRRMDFATWRLLNEDYEKSGGILTYKARIVLDDGKVFREWRHQLWVNLITVTDESPVVQEAD